MNRIARTFDEVERNKSRMIPGKAQLIQDAKSSGRLLAVRGEYDYVEKVTPHCYARVKDLIDPDVSPPDLSGYHVLFVGCPGRISVAEWRQPIHRFLHAGGVMLTTDWCLGNLVEQVFPGTIRAAGVASGKFPLRVRDRGNPLLEGLVDLTGTKWVVEVASERIEIVDSSRVSVVLDAPRMGTPSAVLITCPIGSGLLVHAISHFCLQGADRKGEYVSAYILTNVIDEAMRRRRGIDNDAGG